MAANLLIGRAETPTRAGSDLTTALFERHAATIFAHCLARLGSRVDAEDAVQATFLNAFRSVERGVRPELELAWLFAIANRVISNRRRGAGRRRRVESPRDIAEVMETPAAPGAEPEELMGLSGALARLPESQRRALLLREWRGLKYREICEELGLSQGAVEQLIFRARRSLAEQLSGSRGIQLAGLLSWLRNGLSWASPAKLVVAAVAVAGVVSGGGPHPPAAAPGSGLVESAGRKAVSAGLVRAAPVRIVRAGAGAPRFVPESPLGVAAAAKRAALGPGAPVEPEEPAPAGPTSSPEPLVPPGPTSPEPPVPSGPAAELPAATLPDEPATVDTAAAVDGGDPAPAVPVLRGGQGGPPAAPPGLAASQPLARVTAAADSHVPAVLPPLSGDSEAAARAPDLARALAGFGPPDFAGAPVVAGPPPLPAAAVSATDASPGRPSDAGPPDGLGPGSALAETGLAPADPVDASDDTLPAEVTPDPDPAVVADEPPAETTPVDAPQPEPASGHAAAAASGHAPADTPAAAADPAAAATGSGKGKTH